MLASLIIVFREVLEAGIIVGVVLAATRGVKRRNMFVGGGVACGVAGACLVALGANSIADAFSGNGQEILNAAVLALAVVMLAWHQIWMARHGRELRRDAGDLSRSVVSGRHSLWALTVVVGVTILREGSEVVLLLYSILVSSREKTSGVALGAALGILAGTIVTFVIYYGLARIPMRHLFRVTGLLIAFVAAGLAAQSVAFLAQADILTLGQAQLWNTSALIADDSLTGRTLHVLFGYTSRPTGMQLGVYLAVLATIIGLGARRRDSSLPAASRGLALP